MAWTAKDEIAVVIDDESDTKAKDLAQDKSGKD